MAIAVATSTSRVSWRGRSYTVAEAGAARQRTLAAGDTGETRARGRWDRNNTSNDPPRGAPCQPHHRSISVSTRERSPWLGGEGGPPETRGPPARKVGRRCPRLQPQAPRPATTPAGLVTPSGRGRLQGGAHGRARSVGSAAGRQVWAAAGGEHPRDAMREISGTRGHGRRGDARGGGEASAAAKGEEGGRGWPEPRGAGRRTGAGVARPAGGGRGEGGHGVVGWRGRRLGT